MTVSIALCTYNGEKYIREQIGSFLRQTVPPEEIVVRDDGSTDSTLAIIGELKEKNPSVRWDIAANGRKLGSSRNFEGAIAACSGDVIFLSDQDDRWKEDKIGRTLEVFERSGCGAVFTDADLVDGNGALLKGTLLDYTFFKEKIRKSFRKEDLLYWSLMLGNIMTGATIAVSRSYLPALLPFKLEGKHKLWHDGWIGFSLMGANKVEYLDERLISYRIHTTQQVGISDNKDPFERVIVEGRQPETIGERNRYFPRYLRAFSFLEELKKKCPLGPAVEERITLEYHQQKRSYFKSQALLERKLRLAKWWLKGGNDISFSDLIKL